MLRIVGQIAGPNELKFVVDTHGLPGGGLDKKNSNIKKLFLMLKQKNYFFPQLVFNILLFPS